MAGAPLEEHLGQSTLWPEVHKLYGHGGELSALAADPRGALVASACRVRVVDRITCSTLLCWPCGCLDWTPAFRLLITYAAGPTYPHAVC